MTLAHSVTRERNAKMSQDTSMNTRYQPKVKQPVMNVKLTPIAYHAGLKPNQVPLPSSLSTLASNFATHSDLRYRGIIYVWLGM